MNLKPLLPGHVLVSPRRVVPRLADLTLPEITDLFATVQRVGRMVERVFGASALNIAVQDGPDAGQTVPHVHAHVIPRRADDLGEGLEGRERVYELLEDDNGDLAAWLEQRRRARQATKFPVPDEHARGDRTDDEMQREAEWLRREMDQERP